MRGLRYQKRIKILPFLTVNISKSGYSITLGGKWLKLNYRQGKVFFTSTLVGTGLSYRRQIGGKNGSNK